MTRFIRAAALLAAVTVFAFADFHGRDAIAQSDSWIALFDGKTTDNFTPVGDANWKVANGELTADAGTGFLVSKASYGDFQMRVEFWADDDANSGVFLRLSDPVKITSDNSYEVNIFDKRPDPTYGTGAIVSVSKVDPMPKAGDGKGGGKWNTYEITAKGNRFTVVLNGQKTVDNAEDSKFAKGPFALQRYPGSSKEPGIGTIKFRKVEIRPL